jgi:hypothetical protein
MIKPIKVKEEDGWLISNYSNAQIFCIQYYKDVKEKVQSWFDKQIDSTYQSIGFHLYFFIINVLSLSYMGQSVVTLFRIKSCIWPCTHLKVCILTIAHNMVRI